MRKKGLRRLPVIDKEKIVGIVTLMSLVGNMPIRNIDLAELEAPARPSNITVNCPYCHFTLLLNLMEKVTYHRI